MSIRTALALAALLLGIPATAHAQAPPNDDWANRIALQLPSHSTAEVGQAGTDASDPLLACDVDGHVRGDHSVWYSYTTGAETEYVTLSTAPSPLPVIVSVHAGAPGS